MGREQLPICFSYPSGLCSRKRLTSTAFVSFSALTSLFAEFPGVLDSTFVFLFGDHGASGPGAIGSDPWSASRLLLVC
jgi:hypothetical protein